MSFSLDDYLRDLSELVGVDCGSYTPKGVAQIADLVKKYFARQDGWFCKQVHIHDDIGPMLLVTNKEDASAYDVTILAHMDTVFPEGTVAEYPLRTEGDKLFAPGANDMKAGLLSAVYALMMLDDDTKNKFSVCLALTPDEEIGAVYCYEHIEALAKKSKNVLITEAARANGNILHGRKGNGKIQIDFHGHSCHAALLQNGISAITECAHWIQALNELSDVESGTTLSVGIVKGGTSINTVPDYCQALVDQRFMQNSENYRILDVLENMTKTPFVEGASVSVKKIAGRPAFEVTEKADQLKGFAEKAAAMHDVTFAWEIGGGASDGNITAACGVPTIDGLGPIGAGHHNAKTEFIYISSITPRTMMLKSILEQIADHSA